MKMNHIFRNMLLIPNHVFFTPETISGIFFSTVDSSFVSFENSDTNLQSRHAYKYHRCKRSLIIRRLAGGNEQRTTACCWFCLYLRNYSASHIRHDLPTQPGSIQGFHSYQSNKHLLNLRRFYFFRYSLLWATSELLRHYICLCVYWGSGNLLKTFTMSWYLPLLSDCFLNSVDTQVWTENPLSRCTLSYQRA